MKNENRRVRRLLETMVKNEIRFYRLVLKREDFLPNLKELYLKYSPIKEEFGFHPEVNLGTRSLGQRRNAIELCMKFIELMPAEQRSQFLKTVETVRINFELGKEWTETLIAFVIGGLMYPPVLNLHIEQERILDNRRTFQSLQNQITKRTTLILNPSTSQDDIKDAWPAIEALQRSLWPGFKDVNLNKDSLKKLIEQMRIVVQKRDISDKEKYENLTVYEEQLWKQERRRGKTEREIMKQLRRRQIESGLARKSIKIRKKRTDVEIVKEMFKTKNPADLRKAVNRIRKNRERSKR